MLTRFKTNRNVKQSILFMISLMLLSNPTLLRAQWVQDEFVIGGWQGPRFDGSSDSAYEAKLQQVVDSGINLLYGNLSGFPAGYNQYQTGAPNDPDIVYQLSRIARVNQNSGGIVLRTLVEDRRYSGTNKTTLPADLNDYTVGLTTQQREAQYGYALGDEPYENQLINKQNQVTEFRTLDPDRLAFINLFSNRVSIFDQFGNPLAPFHGDPDRYREYVRNLASVADVVSFDNYPFITDQRTQMPGNDDFIRNEYFQNHQIVAEESDIAGVPFWAFPMAVEHRSVDTNGNVVIEHDGPADYGVGLTEAHLRFMAFVPVIYGARGIGWFTYDTPCQTRTGCSGSGWIYEEAMLDFLGNPTDSANPVPNIGPIYDWVTLINSQLRNMGPRLMNLRWLYTVHGSTVNNMGDTPISTYVPPGQPARGLESDLPTVGQDTPPIVNDFEDQFAVGIMENMASASYHLLILNKDLITPRTITLELDRDYAQYRHRRSVNSWRQLSGGSRQVSLMIQPGDMEMVRLELVPPPVVHNINAYFPPLGPDDEDVKKTLDTNSVCEPGFTKGTFTIRARFENTSTDTTLADLAFKVKELSGGSILCNADGAVGGTGATVAVARADDYADGLLGPGEHFEQTFEIGLDMIAPFTLLVDLFGVIAIDETAPSLIQSTFGPKGNKNMEVVVRESNNKLHQYFREKDDNGDFVWQLGSETFADGATSAPSLIQSTLGPEDNNFEVVVRGSDRQLHHYFREKDASGKFVWMEGSEPFAPKSTSAASLIQSTFGPEGNKNLEIVVRESDNKLHHYFRVKDENGKFVWKSGGEPFADNVTSAPALKQSNLGRKEDNFEVVVRQGDKLYHWFRKRVSDDPLVFEWKFGDVLPAENVTSAPSLIQSTLDPDGDNLEVVVRQADNKLHHYFRERVSDEPEVFEWKEGGVVEPAEDVMSGPSLIQGTLGPSSDNFELVVREDGGVRHYFRERDAQGDFVWAYGDDVIQ